MVVAAVRALGVAARAARALGADALGELVRLDVDEGEERAGDDRVALALDGVAIERLVVGGDKDCDLAVDPLGNDAFIDRE